FRMGTPPVFARAEGPELGQRSRKGRKPDSLPSNKPSSKPTASAAGTYEDDAAVVRDAEVQAIEQAEAASRQQDDARAAAFWAVAIKEMEKALEHLKQATNSPASLPEAVAAEQAAYQALLKLQQHEYQVMRNRNRNQSGGGGAGQQMQRQLEQ